MDQGESHEGVLLIGLEPGRLSDAHLASVRALAPGMRIVVTEDRAEIETLLDDIEVIFWRFPRDLLARATNLRWFQQLGAGADWLLRHPEAARASFVLTNASGVHPINITEHILAFLLSFARRFKPALRAQSCHEWLRSKGDEVFELAGKTLLLIGVGSIGQRTAAVTSAMGMRVIGVRRSASVAVPGVEAMLGPDQLLEALPQADFVVLTAPLTPETRGMIGERELRAMKPSAYVINVGRGGTIQQMALVRALEEGWIAGAGLDVFETEPLPEDSPLWDMDNVLITAHYAGATPHYLERAVEIFLTNLKRYVAGEPLLNVVDKAAGY